MPPPANPGPLREPTLDEIIACARELTSGTAFGVLCTVDGRGCPRARWMGCVVEGSFDQLLSLTAATSRKVGEIRARPEVQWIFTAPDMSRVITFNGRAHILDHVEDVKRYWTRIPDKTRAYFLHGSLSGLGVAVIQTEPEIVEFSVPASNIMVTVELAELRARLAATQP